MTEVSRVHGIETAEEIAEDRVENHLTLKRGFNFRAIFALAFSDISPIVSIYTVFGIIVAISGAGFWFAMPIVLIGQLLVASVFGDVASRFPLAGSVYQWSRYLVNARFGWFTAWAYIWGLTIALATLSYGAAGFLLGVLGVNGASHNEQALVAVALTVFACTINIAGRKVLKYFFYFSIAAEVICSVVLGSILLIGYRVNPFSALVHSAGAVHGGAYLTGPFLAAMAVAGWSFLGFESAGSVAEEVDEPGRAVPRAIFFSLLAVGLIVIAGCDATGERRLHVGLRRRGIAHVLLRRDRVVFVLVGRDGPVVADASMAVSSLARARLGDGCTVGVSDPLGDPSRAPAASREALWALAGATSARPIVTYGEASPLPALHSPEEAHALVDRVLGSLLAYDLDNGTDLVYSLATFLSTQRSWQRCALALHVHRQTVIYRMRRVEQLTGRSLSETGDIATLWLALSALEILRQGDTPSPVGLVGGEINHLGSGD